MTYCIYNFTTAEYSPVINWALLQFDEKKRPLVDFRSSIRVCGYEKFKCLNLKRPMTDGKSAKIVFELPTVARLIPFLPKKPPAVNLF